MKLFRFVPLVGLLALGACNPALQAGASMVLSDVPAIVAPACAALAKGNVPVTNLCVDASGALVSILSVLAKNGIKAHLDGNRLVLDQSIPAGRWGHKLRGL